MRMIRIVAAATLLLAVVGAPVGVTARRTFTTEIRNVGEKTHDDSVREVSGNLISQERACLGGRSVRVVLDQVNIEFGTDVTDADGNFVVRGFGPRDQDYRVDVFAKRVHGFRCGPASFVDELG